MVISATTRLPDTTRPEDKQVWVEIFDPPTGQPANLPTRQFRESLSGQPAGFEGRPANPFIILIIFLRFLIYKKTHIFCFPFEILAFCVFALTTILVLY